MAPYRSAFHRLVALRPVHLGHAYAIAALALAAKLLLDAAVRTRDLCDLFPQFDYWSTFRDELAAHRLLVPGLGHASVATGGCIALLLAAWGTMTWGLGVIDRAWGLAMDVLTGRWLYEFLTVQVPAWLPFLQSDPGLPELISENEEDGEGETEVSPLEEDMVEDPRQQREKSVKAKRREAMVKLLQVKAAHANCTIARPDDWLVFDPVAEELVLQTQYEERTRQRRQKQEGSSRRAGKTGSVDGSGTESDRTSEATTEESDSCTTAEACQGQGQGHGLPRPEDQEQEQEQPIR